MVDSIRGINGPNPLQGVSKTSARPDEGKRSEKAASSEPVDAVEISPEASEAQALQLANETRDILTQLREEALTRGGQKFDTLL